jgi:hypothetical protein
MEEVVALVGTTGLDVAVELVSFSVATGDGGQDVLVDCATDKKVGHLHRVLLSKAPCTAHGLAVGCWVPAQLNEDDLTHLLEVDSHSAGVSGE